MKISWTLIPILPKASAKNQWPLIPQILLIVIELLINHWNYRWFINCEIRVSYGNIFMLYLSIMTITYIHDTSMVLVRIVTRDTIELLIQF
jgi:hypothetical protein